MTYLTAILTQPACRALGWALLQFIWQGTLAALVLAGCNFALREAPARLRYGVSCVFLVVMLALPVVTFTSSLAHAPAPQPMPRAALQVVGDTGDAASAPMIEPPAARDFFTPLLPWTVALWGLGVLALSLRWIGTWTYLLAAFAELASFPTPDEWQRALRDLMRRAAISIPVRLSLQAQIHVPCVIGWLLPVIFNACGIGWFKMGFLASARSAAGPRTGTHSPLRLPGKSATDGGRYAAVLSSGRVVGIASNPHRAGKLLRRYGCSTLWRPADLCAGFSGSGTDPRDGAGAGNVRTRRRPPAAHPAAGASEAGKAQPGMGAGGGRDGDSRVSGSGPAQSDPRSSGGYLEGQRNSGDTPAVAPTAMLPTARPKPIQIAPRSNGLPLQMATAAAPTQEPTPEPAEESHDFLSEIVAAGFHNLSVDELLDRS